MQISHSSRSVSMLTLRLNSVQNKINITAVYSECAYLDAHIHIHKHTRTHTHLHGEYSFVSIYSDDNNIGVSACLFAG